jgi:DNA-binding SARP family transcriptional activator
MDVLLLGPVELTGASGSVPVRRRQERLLLAALAVRAPRYVSLDRLVDLIWDGDEPARPSTAVQSMVAHLRAALRRAAPGSELIASCRQGYALRTPRETIDLYRVVALVEAARAAGPGVERIERFGDALECWRGPAVIDIGEEAARRRVLGAHVDLWQSTYEQWLAAHVEIGRHHQVIDPLSSLAWRQPLSEPIQHLLMLALHQAGRRAEALEVYTRTRRHLAAELGLEPGPALRATQRRLLHGLPRAPTGGVGLCSRPAG